MSWKDRLQSSIILVSPGGTQFEAQWSGNTRTLEKKVGIFTYPKIPGAVVQDLDVGGFMYPLTIYFEGTDNDITAGQFLEACKENGRWNITHPVRGALSLQLLSVTEEIEPVESGNITKINMDWIEPIDLSLVPSSQQIASSIFSQSEIVNTSALSQFETVFQDTYSEVAAIQKTVDSVVDKVKKTLSPIYESASGINSRIVSIQRSIQDFITQPTIDLAGVAGQIQNLFQLPVLAIEDTQARISAYTAMVTEIIGIEVPDSTTESYNVVAVKELSLTANHTAIAQVAATSLATVATRPQAIELSETISQAFIDMTDSLDAAQELFIDEDIDTQYFSQSQSFYDSSIITALGAQYLLVSSFDLKKEKRFILRQPKAPVAITIEEYGELGENDVNFDTFIESNGLKALEILLLPAGREVVVYV